MAEAVQREQPAYPIGSVDKALRLLLMVAEKPGGVRIGDAAAALSVAPSTAHRLLQMLSLHGFARQDPATKAYHAGETISRLADPRERARQAALPLLRELVDEFQETAHLGTLDGMQALTLFSVESPHMLRVGDRSGHTQPAHLSGMGRALLSGQELADVAAAARAEDPALDERALASHLRDIAERGYILQHGEVESGVSALAAPVRGATGSVEYAIGVTFPTGRIADADVPHLADAVKHAAAQLEEELRR
ncbi:IclR family transcriptional regulator [Microbacterium gallinarum]|uniref:IclR family transcriptional regulator n=1 Tax=Microbacterium gallinarum TaxID=2762209 RepID=A0ABR8X078_9MICO|nr:IclR family transcriptional regulator [Microbacterium gallinarum]MBD8022745.1 IclR family transcriptional regulator [Microbacterium gallinarum]